MDRPAPATPVPTRAAAPLLVAAGVLFAAYPALRPYTDETALDGAAAFASPAWALAHLCAMAGFVLLPLALLAAFPALGGSRAAGAAVVTAWLGSGLVLPYYGAETFGLAALGDRALQDGDLGLLAVADVVRFAAAPATVFLGGFVLLAAAGVLVATALTPRWAGVPLAAGLLLFVPQFFAAPGLRIAHGVLMAVGCLGVAWAVTSRSAAPGRGPRAGR